MTPFESLKDFIDLMLHPGRRVKQRDMRDDELERNFQSTIVNEARLKSDIPLWASALNSRRDWGNHT